MGRYIDVEKQLGGYKNGMGRKNLIGGLPKKKGNAVEKRGAVVHT